MFIDLIGRDVGPPSGENMCTAPPLEGGMD